MFQNYLIIQKKKKSGGCCLLEQLVAWSLEQRTKSKPENAIYLFLMVLSNNSGPLAFCKIEIEKKNEKNRNRKK